MSDVDPFIWICLFVLAIIPVALLVVEISSRRLDRKFGRRGD